MNDLSRDTENANDPLGQIFDKQKEQDRMDALDLVKDIAAQAKELGNSYDRLQAESQLDKNNLPKKIEEDAQKDYNNLSAEDKAKYKDFEDYYSQNNNYYYYAAIDYQVTENRKNGNNAGGIGSSLNKGIDAASSIIAGIIRGDIIGGLAGASAPYLAEQIKLATGEKDPITGEWKTTDKEANLIAHAILGAAVAAAQGNSALAGAGGAASGEAIAEYIKDTLYGENTKLEDLTEAQKQNISNLAQLATGLAAAAASGGSVSDAGAAASASKNAVENNALAIFIDPTDIKLTEETKDVYDICPKYNFDCVSAYFYSKNLPPPYTDTIPKELIETSTLLPYIGEADAIHIALYGKNLAGDDVDPIYGWLGILTFGYGQKANLLTKFENKVISDAVKNLAQKTPDLPKNYKVEGDSIVGPKGGVYTNTGKVDASGNIVYSNNGRYYTFENGVKTQTTSPNINTGSQIQQNYQKGKDFEQTIYDEYKTNKVESAREITIKTESDTSIRVDMIGKDKQGNITCVECKSSQTAPLTDNQKVGFPELEKSGGVIVGEGKPGFEGGTIIPPTKVEIIRPND